MSLQSTLHTMESRFEHHSLLSHVFACRQNLDELLSSPVKMENPNLLKACNSIKSRILTTCAGFWELHGERDLEIFGSSADAGNETSRNDFGATEMDLSKTSHTNKAYVISRSHILDEIGGSEIMADAQNLDTNPNQTMSDRPSSYMTPMSRLMESPVMPN